MREEMKNELKNEQLEKISGGFPPELPATNPGESAYQNMFAPCEPIIPGGSEDMPGTDR